MLSGFIGLNRLGQKELLEQYIVSLSRMLRYVLDKKDQSTLKDEFDFLVSYCNLQKMRFSRKGFDFSMELDPALGNLLFPKLLLQPLVENTIIHGIEPINRACSLVVSASMHIENDISYVVIVVKDDGAGFSKEPHSGTHIGLDNVQERLQLVYQQATFAIHSEQDVVPKQPFKSH